MLLISKKFNLATEYNLHSELVLMNTTLMRFRCASCCALFVHLVNKSARKSYCQSIQLVAVLIVTGGRYRIRTSDFLRVRQAQATMPPPVPTGQYRTKPLQ